MKYIRPVSDLRNKYPEIENLVLNEGEAVYLTKNGYGSMVVMSIDKYCKLTDDVEIKLDEAEKEADITDTRYSHDDVFSNIRRKINGK